MIEQNTALPHSYAENLSPVPVMERKYGLMYLAVRLHSLSRSSVDIMAEKLNAGGLPTLYELCLEAKLSPLPGLPEFRPRGSDRIDRDPFLKHVCIEYSETEMAEQFPEDLTGADDLLVTLADALAGEGHSRPLLKDLYSLNSLGLVIVEREGDRNESFAPSHQARQLASALHRIFDLREWRPTERVVMGKFATDMRVIDVNIDESSSRKGLFGWFGR